MLDCISLLREAVVMLNVKLVQELLLPNVSLTIININLKS